MTFAVAARSQWDESEFCGGILLRSAMHVTDAADVSESCSDLNYCVRMVRRACRFFEGAPRPNMTFVPGGTFRNVARRHQGMHPASSGKHPIVRSRVRREDRDGNAV